MSDDRVERELFFRSSSDPCFVLDVDEGPRYTLSAINPAYERLTGLRAADVVGQSPVEYMPPDVRATVEQRLGHVAATGEIAEYVEQLSFPAGARVWRTRLIPIRNDRGQVRRLLGFGRDLTDARRAEASLAASERRYRELLETLYGGVWQIDREGMTTFVNPRMAEMLGYRVERDDRPPPARVLRGLVAGLRPGEDDPARRRCEGRLRVRVPRKGWAPRAHARLFGAAVRRERALRRRRGRRARHHRAAARPGGARDARAQAAGDAEAREPRRPGRRHRPRLQQHPHRDPRLDEPRANGACAGRARRGAHRARSRSRRAARPTCAARCWPTPARAAFSSSCWTSARSFARRRSCSI